MLFGFYLVVQAFVSVGMSFSAAWCHGAPGIGLTRLRLLQLTADDALGSEVRAAVDATLASLRDPRSAMLSNFSLCHGAPGNAELLLLAGHTFGDASLTEAARQVGELGISQVHERGGEWPSGNPNGLPTPGLMLGDAGVGLFYLRLHDPHGTPPAVLIGPQPPRPNR